jgi:enoyl-CoA hydratase/carnithine racemase
MLESVDHLNWDISDHIATLTITRPEKRNAMTDAMYRGMRRWLFALDEAPEVRVIVIRGEGPIFCAGSDMSSFGDKSGPERERHFGYTADFFLAISQITKPVIAAPRGYALGGGTALTAASDFAVAEEDALFGIPEIKHGFWPCTIMPPVIRAVGARRAYELFVTGRRFSAAEAVVMGLVTKSAPVGKFEDELAAFARQIADTSPYAVQMGKRAFYEIEGIEYNKAVRLMSKLMPNLLESEDAKKGIAAFFEKRISERHDRQSSDISGDPQ